MKEEEKELAAQKVIKKARRSTGSATASGPTKRKARKQGKFNFKSFLNF